AATFLPTRGSRTLPGYPAGGLLRRSRRCSCNFASVQGADLVRDLSGRHGRSIGPADPVTRVQLCDGKTSAVLRLLARRRDVNRSTPAVSGSGQSLGGVSVSA